MAVKASAQITIYHNIDIDSMYRYYLLQSSTLTAPSKPTTYPPSSAWDDVEPTYVEGSTNSLYFMDCTNFSNGTFQYSEVSLSSSYEAAKLAYNKAANAQNGVDNLTGTTESLVENVTNIVKDCESIVLDALASYTETSDFEEFKSLTESQFKLMSDQLNLTFTELSSEIGKVDGELQSKFNQISTFFTFDIYGFTIGKTESPYKIFMDDNEFAMMIGDTRVLYFELSENSQKANIPNLSVTDALNMFGYGVSDIDGIVSCEYVGYDGNVASSTNVEDGNEVEY